MRKLWGATVLAGVLVAVLASGAFAGIPDRIREQQHRIDQGIASGQLSRAEADTLQDNLNWVKERYGRLRADGLLTPAEQANLNRMLDRTNDMIYNKKHNPIGRVYESNFRDRINDQQRRIDQGIASGQLTPGEANIVQDNLNWIKSQLANFEANGRLTPPEQDRLDRMLDQNNDMIFNKKHNPARRLY